MSTPPWRVWNALLKTVCQNLPEHDWDWNGHLLMKMLLFRIKKKKRFLQKMRILGFACQKLFLEKKVKNTSNWLSKSIKMHKKEAGKVKMLDYMWKY